MYTLIYSLYGAPEGAEHPQKAMAALGIKYVRSEPQPIADQWMFFDCENVPDELPKHIRFQRACALCGTTENLTTFNGDPICKECNW